MYPFSNIAAPQMLPLGVLPGAVYVPNQSMSFSMTPMHPQQSYYYSMPPTLTPLPAATLTALPKITVPLSKPPNPTTTIFIGNINDKASDILVKTIFGKMGNIISWKRVQGVGGKMQAFGFCEYDHPESTLRAIRLLHEFDLAGKKLVVKVDAKSKEKLKEYRNNKKKEAGVVETDNSSNKEEGEACDDDEKDDEWLDPIIKKKDKSIVDEIKKYIKDNIPSYTQENEQLQATKEKLSKTQKLGNIVLDEEKTEVISKEILRFKENNIRDEKYREKIREKGREKREREKMLKGSDESKSSRTAASPINSNSAHESRTDRWSAANEERSVKKSRSWTKSPSRRGEKRRDRTRSPTFVDEENIEKMRKKRLAREIEEEEAHERRKLERKLREKETSYQEQLRIWEQRESKKHREHSNEKEFEDSIKTEELREAKRLREFLEDYLDERDDNKYYKGTFLARRLKEREKEMEMDLKDRQKEKEEIEELKQKLKTECHPNLEEEVAKLEKGRSQHLQPQLNLDQNGEPIASTDTSYNSPLKSSKKKKERSHRKETKNTNLSPHNTSTRQQHKDSVLSPSNTSMRSPSVPKDDSRLNNDMFVPIAETSDLNGLGNNQQSPKETNGIPMDTSESSKADDVIKPLGFKSISLGLSGEKKKGTFETFFDADDDTDGMRKRLPPLDLLDDGQSKPLTLEEKRQSIKKLIEKIPTTKPQLFAYEIDWEMVDAPLMEKRIRPWINKKIIEYIGEEEPTLVEFISSKLLTKSTPQAILDDILMVLDEEAEVFVVKMWRLLIYEIEAKKAGLVKCE